MRCNSNRCRTSVFDAIEQGFHDLGKGAEANDGMTADNPRLTVLEFDNRYVVELDLPGVSSKDISLHVDENILSVSARRSSVVASDHVRILLNERPAAEFTRKIQLARAIEQSAIDAELNNGVLVVTLPKRSEVLPKKIAIKSGMSQSADQNS